MFDKQESYGKAFSLCALNLQFDSQMIPKIFDFGLTKTTLIDISYSSKSLFESAAWTAPEYLKPKRIAERTERGDIFGFGVIAWELVTRKEPWERVQHLEVIEKVTKGERLPFTEEFPENLKNMITTCWNNGKQ